MNYHERPEVSASMLKSMASGWRQFEAEYITRTAPRKETPAMAFGTALHSAVLEAYQWGEQYVVCPADIGDRRTKAYKAWASQHEGKRVITWDDLDTINRIGDSIQRDQIASKLLIDQPGRVEQMLTWIDSATDVPCRAKVDKLLGRVVIDIKTTDDARPQAFSRKIADLRYDLQAVHYLEGSKAETFIFVACETSAPWRVRCYTLTEQDLQASRAERIQLLEQYQLRKTVGDWSEHGEHSVIDIELPKYFKRGTSNE